MSQRIVIFRRLSSWNVPLASVLRAFRYDVFFLEPVGALRDHDAIARLSSRGIKWVRHAKLPDFDLCAFDRVQSRCADAIRARLFPERSAALLSGSLSAFQGDRKKALILLYETISNTIAGSIAAIALAEYFLDRGYKAGVWQEGGLLDRWLYRGATPVANFVPGPLRIASLLARFAVASVGKVSNLLRPGLSVQGSARAKPDAAEGLPNDNRNAKVLFFPHQGISYGGLFEKGQYYSADAASPFHRDAICHIELGSLLSREMKQSLIEDYAARNVPVVMLSTTQTLKTRLQEFYGFLRKVGLLGGLIPTWLAFLTASRVASAQRALAAFPRAKVALLGYEYIFPRWLCAALQACGIRVVATQERFILAFLPGFSVLLDDYLVHGEVVRERLEKSPFSAVRNTVVIGDVRTDILRKHGPDPSSSTSPHRRHLSVALDYHTVEDEFADGLTYGTDVDSNRQFYLDIIRLSQRFDEVDFVIRGKDDRWWSMRQFEDIRQVIEARSNIRVDHDYSISEGSYRLAANADSLIIRPTSLGDQSLAIRKPVLFADYYEKTTRHISGLVEYPYGIIARSFDELVERFGRIVQSGHYLTPEEASEVARRFYAHPVPQGSVRQRLSAYLELTP